MEYLKKSKKLKKRRSREKIRKSKEPRKCSEDIEIEDEIKVDSDINFLHQSQLVQTDLSVLFEESRDTNEKDEQIKSLTERLQQVTSKLYESKNAYTSLKQDYNKVQKLLCSEVGENVTAASLLNQPGWRGRADQILQLQQKVSELQSQLKVSDTDSTRKKSVERRSLSGVRIFDREKKQQIENLTKDLKEAETAQENLKKRLEAAKARRSVLENDLGTAKKTINLLNEKTTHDNQLIEALHAQLKVSENKLEEKDANMKRQSDKYEREIILVRSELEAAQIHIKNFKRQIDEKDQELENLRTKIKAYQSRERQDESCDGSPNQSPRSTKNANEYIAMGIAAEAEKDRLLELVMVLNRRLDKERNDLEQTSELLKKERCKAAKLETKVQKLELERAGLSRVNPGSYRFKSSKNFAPANEKTGNMEDFELKFELLQEECLALKTRLATLQREKGADLASFKKMLEQTRKIFKDACRGKMPMGSHTNSVVTI